MLNQPPCYLNLKLSEAEPEETYNEEAGEDSGRDAVLDDKLLTSSPVSICTAVRVKQVN
jgi:hypothetical protein